MSFYSFLHIRKDPGSSESLNQFNLITFNNTFFGKFHVKEALEEEDKDNYIQVQVVVDRLFKNLYINLSEYSFLTDRIKPLSLEKRSQEINDYILFRSENDSKIIEQLQAFMRLGIDDKEYQNIIMSHNSKDIIMLPNVFDQIFIGRDIQEKIEDYIQKRLKFHFDPQCLIILDKVFKNGLAIKIFKEKDIFYHIPKDLQSTEFELALILNDAENLLDSAVIKATECGFDLLVRFFLSEDREISKSSLDKAFLVAVMKNNKSIVEFLLTEKITEKPDLLREIVDLEFVNRGESYNSIIKMIVSKFPEIACEAIKSAARRNDELLVLSLLEIYPEYFEYAVLSAVKRFNESLVRVLLSNHKTLSDESFLLSIRYSVYFENQSLFDFLLLKGRRLSEEEYKDVIGFAASAGNIKLVSRILKYYPQYLYEAVFFAISNHKNDLVKELLSEGKSIAPDELGRCIVFLSVNNSEQLIRFLLSEGKVILKSQLIKSIHNSFKNGFESQAMFLLTQDKTITMDDLEDLNEKK